MIPTEGLLADRLAREQTRKIKEIEKPKSDVKKGFELFQPSKKKRGPGKKTKVKNETPRKGIHIRPTEFCSDIMIDEIMQGIQEIANSQLRSLPQQVLWILKQKVEEWRKENGTTRGDKA